MWWIHVKLVTASGDGLTLRKERMERKKEGKSWELLCIRQAGTGFYHVGVARSESLSDIREKLNVANIFQIYLLFVGNINTAWNIHYVYLPRRAWARYISILEKAYHNAYRELMEMKSAFLVLKNNLSRNQSHYGLIYVLKNSTCCIENYIGMCRTNIGLNSD